jgi:exonuclease III
MKGIFWNSKGLHDLAKSGFLSQTTKEENLDFICLQETGRSDFSANELKHFGAGKEFIWSWTKPKGRSGGILFGVNVENFDIADISQGDFYIMFRLRNKIENFEWVLIAVYGAAQNEFKEGFLRELVHTVSNETNPVLSARQFTWANSLPIPTYEKLDRIMVSTDWELKYQKVTVQAITRHLSDHTPLLIDTGEITSSVKIHLFKFELCWLLREDFYGIVAEIWQQENNGHTPLEIWQNKIRRLRKYLRGWSKNYIGAFRKEKEELSHRIDQLDKKAETTVLQQHEVDLQYSLKERLTTLLTEEEIKWH